MAKGENLQNNKYVKCNEPRYIKYMKIHNDTKNAKNEMFPLGRW